MRTVVSFQFSFQFNEAIRRPTLFAFNCILYTKARPCANRSVISALVGTTLVVLPDPKRLPMIDILRSSFSCAQRTNSFTLDIKLKPEGERVVSSLVLRRNSVSTREMAASSANCSVANSAGDTGGSDVRKFS